MEMEVVIPVQNMDFDFNSARSSPYVSAPSTPKRLGEYYFSAPTSPTKISEFYRDFDDFLMVSGGNSITAGGGDGSSAAVPFDWEEKPGTPKSSSKLNTKYEDDFAFDFSEELERTSLSAEELFDGGKIRPLKPPPRLQLPAILSPRSPRSPISHGKKLIRGAFSPRQKKIYSDPFAAAELENSRGTRTPDQGERGRERVSALSSSTSGRRGTRSLSPLRVSAYPWEEENRQQQNTKQQSPMISSKPPLPSSTASALSSSSSSSSKGYRKWRLKDFFLFRSASEGRAADKDPLKKYTALFRRQDDIKNSSFRAIESPGSVSSSRRRGPVLSAHELHYTVNRAVSEDLKKKTFLPYKQGILGRLAFNPSVHALANGFGFSRK